MHLTFFNFFIKKFNYLTTRFSDIRVCWFFFIFVILNELLIVISNTWFDGINSSFVFPSGPNPVLVFIFVTWVYTWGISNLRRTLYGRFTRGDRKLWFKSFASFWIVELVTVSGLYIAACWMSWGPAPVIHRNFLIPTRGFIVELSFLTFIVWGLYLLRFFIKWNSWKSSSIMTVFIIILTACLIWRDLTLFWGRETMSFNSGARWRYIDQQIPRYSVCPSWWVSHFIGHDKFVSSDLSIDDVVKSLSVIPTYTEYERSNILPSLNFDSWYINSLPLSSYFDSFDNNSLKVYNSVSSIFDYSSFDLINRSFNENILYPRRVGFATKKLAMWTLFVILKMWHHVILFYWWFLFLLRLVGTKKNAYSLLSTCWFNVYCCFIISLLIYIFSLLPFYENFLRLKPLKIRSLLFRRSTYEEALEYAFSLFTFERRSYKHHITENWYSFIRLVNQSMLDHNFFYKYDYPRIGLTSSLKINKLGLSFITEPDMSQKFYNIFKSAPRPADAIIPSIVRI